MDMTDVIMAKAMSYVNKEENKVLSEDDFYELALESFHTACDDYEKENPSITDESDGEDGYMWYDELLDDGIIDGIMETMLECGFTTK